MASRTQASTVAVTGATGFVGARVAAQLVEEGHDVRVTYRRPERLAVLAGVEVEPVKADVMDRAAMRRALKGCDTLFHVAGVVGRRGPVFEVNALGPRIAVEAAADAGVGRVVLTSSVAGVGPARPGEIADEDQPYWSGHLGLTYIDSKHEGEATALAAAARTGIELVIVQPSYVLGAGLASQQAGETSTRVIGNYLRGRLPAIVDSWTNISDVEDVAAGHLLAWRKGRPGERYILGGENVRWAEIIRRIASISGIEHPIGVIPPGVEPLARLAIALRLPTPISFEAITLMAQNYRYSSAKAEKDLGYRWRPLEEVLERTVAWYMELIEAGAFEGPDVSPVRLLSRGVHLADRVGVLPIARRLTRLAARPFDPTQ